MISMLLQELKPWILPRTGQWYQCAPLPQLHCSIRSTILPICKSFMTSTAWFKKVCLDDLISQATSQPAEVGASAPPVPSPSPWQGLPDTPRAHSSALPLRGALL